MIRKFKKWLQGHYLPMWAKNSVLEDNRKLASEVDKLNRKIIALNAYIDGMERGIRSRNKIVISGGGDGKK